MLICHPALAQSAAVDQARKVLEYDRALALDFKVVSTMESKSARVRDVSFASPKGGRVTAYVVEPKRGGRHAGIVYGHWGNGNRTEFLGEAMLMAAAGTVSVLIDYPWERTGEWWVNLPGLSEPEARNRIYVQAITDLRRAFDVLLSRADVDPTRIAYVGHSYGAQWGAILAAVDQRMKTAVLMAGVPSAASLWLESTGDAGLVAYRKEAPKGQIEKFVEVHSPFDANRFAPHAAPVRLFFQFARQERVMTVGDMAEYFRAASEPKQAKWYDAGHELMVPEATRDRLAWLRRELGLRPRRASRGH
jgi:cephalosporin-C deacetylase-like acetyl esterase